MTASSALDASRGRQIRVTAADPAHSDDPRRLILRDHVGAAVSRAVVGALDQLPGDARAGAVVVLAAHDYCVTMIREFVAAWHRADGKPRAMHSMALESSRLLQPLGESGWLGRATVIVSPDRAREQAVRWATALIATGRAAHVVVCELRGGEPGGLVTAIAVPLSAVESGRAT